MSLTGIELNAHRHQGINEDNYIIIHWVKKKIFILYKTQH